MIKKIFSAFLFTAISINSSYAKPDNSIEKINSIVEQALAEKKFNAKIQLEVNMTDENAHSPGYAIYDFKEQICKFKINTQALKESIFTERLFKFFIYHELSHCHFFANPFTISNFKELNNSQNKILNDFIFLDILIQTEKRLNAYNVYHEAYADVMAMALLLKEGYTPEDFKSLKELRLDDFLDGHHNTSSGFSSVFKEDWKNIDSKTFEETVAIISMKITINNFFDDFYKKYSGTENTLFGIFKSNIQSMVSSYYYDFKVDQEFHKERFNLLLVNNSIIEKYPLWNFVSENMLVIPKQKIADNFLLKMNKELYDIHDEKTMMTEMQGLETFIKSLLNNEK